MARREKGLYVVTLSNGKTLRIVADNPRKALTRVKNYLDIEGGNGVKPTEINEVK